MPSAVLTEIGREHNIEVVATKDGTVFDGDLSGYDAFLFYTTGDLTQAGTDGQPPMTAAGKQKLIDAVAAGKGFLASHCGSDTFHGKGDRRSEQPAADRDPYIQMLGGEFISHGPQQTARQVVCSPQFPGLSGAGDSFALNEEWYSLKNFADDLHVILLQDTQGMQGEDYQRPPFPSTWARRHGKGRVFYTSMGHREDVWTNPTFQQILLGGLAWSFGDAKFEPTPNLTEKTPGAAGHASAEGAEAAGDSEARARSRRPNAAGSAPHPSPDRLGSRRDPSRPAFAAPWSRRRRTSR